MMLRKLQIGTAALYACIGLGVGGNLPVDGALFLEFIPCASGALLTLLSAWWPVGQLISSLCKLLRVPHPALLIASSGLGIHSEFRMSFRWSLHQVKQLGLALSHPHPGGIYVSHVLLSLLS